MGSGSCFLYVILFFAFRFSCTCRVFSEIFNVSFCLLSNSRANKCSDSVKCCYYDICTWARHVKERLCKIDVWMYSTVSHLFLRNAHLNLFTTLSFNPHGPMGHSASSTTSSQFPSARREVNPLSVSFVSPAVAIQRLLSLL